MLRANWSGNAWTGVWGQERRKGTLGALLPSPPSVIVVLPFARHMRVIDEKSEEGRSYTRYDPFFFSLSPRSRKLKYVSNSRGGENRARVWRLASGVWHLARLLVLFPPSPPPPPTPPFFPRFGGELWSRGRDACLIRQTVAVIVRFD